jgi:hypothetical protein
MTTVTAVLVYYVVVTVVSVRLTEEPFVVGGS